MSNQEYKEIQDALLQQRETVGKSKEASKKVLVDLGIYHLLVPEETKESGSPTS